MPVTAQRLGARSRTVANEVATAVPGDRGLERLGEDARRDQRVAQVGRPQEGVAPGALGAARGFFAERPRLAARPRRCRRGPRRARARAPSTGPARGRPTRSRARAGPGARPRRRSAPVRAASRRVEQAAVRGVEAGLGQGAHRLRARSKASNSTPADSRKRGRVLHAHPGLGDHAEDALGADQHPVRARAGARAGQPPALPDAARRERPHRLDEVVDVRVERGEVAAGAGGDPAAERRVLERLRVVAQRQPVLAQLLLERRPEWRPPGCARRARPRRPRAPGRARPGRSTPPAASGGGSTPPTTLVPPP